MEVHKIVFSQYMAALSNNIAFLLPDKLNKSFFLNSGAEAVEAAIKVCCKSFKSKRKYILYSDKSYHGKLIGSGSISGSYRKDKQFPLMDNCVSFKFNDPVDLENKINNLQIKSKSGDKNIKNQLNLVNTLLESFNEQHQINFNNCSEEQLQIIKDLNLITHKPMLYICNVDEKSIVNGNNHSILIQEKGKKEDKLSVIVSAAIEYQISQFDNENDKIELLKELKLEETALKKIINSGYNLLNLITFFSSKPNETRAWTVTKNTKARIAAGKIHSDFEKGFIRAETISYDDFLHFKGEAGCRLAGKLRQEGKDYIVQDGDIFNFLFNV